MRSVLLKFTFCWYNWHHVFCLQGRAERMSFVLTEGNVVCLTKCMNERIAKILLISAFHTHQHGVWLEGSMGNINLYMAMNIHLWGSLKRSIPGLSVLWCTFDITGHLALSPETQHSWHFEIKYALLQIFKGRSQECLTKDIHGHFFPNSNTFNQHKNSAKFIFLEKCVTSRGEN
jgi:hypothetical protein